MSRSRSASPARSFENERNMGMAPKPAFGGGGFGGGRIPRSEELFSIKVDNMSLRVWDFCVLKKEFFFGGKKNFFAKKNFFQQNQKPPSSHEPTKTTSAPNSTDSVKLATFSSPLTK